MKIVLSMHNLENHNDKRWYTASLVTNIEFILLTFFKPSCSMRSRRWSSWNCTRSSTLIAMLFNCKQSSHIGWYRTCLLSSVASFSARRIIRLHHLIAIYQLLFTWYLGIIRMYYGYIIHLEPYPCHGS